MRLIDRFSAAAVRPHGTRSDGHPQAAVNSATPNPSPGSAHHEPVNAPMTRPRSRTRATRARGSTHRLFVLLLIVELAVLALVLTASSTHAEIAQVIAQPPKGAPTGGVTDVLDRIRTWIMGILAGL